MRAYERKAITFPSSAVIWWGSVVDLLAYRLDRGAVSNKHGKGLRKKLVFLPLDWPKDLRQALR
jgi:hypothetical protein